MSCSNWFKTARASAGLSHHRHNHTPIPVKMSARIASSRTPGFVVPAGFGSQRPQAGANAWAKDLKSFMRTFAQPAKQTEMTGLVFQPFSEVQPELSTVGSTPATSSFAKVEFNEECEAAINEQINIEYTISYVYHALHAFFDRDNVGLPGFAKFFDEASKEEREHAQLLIEYQNKRGGRVQLKALAMPEMEFADDKKGEALYAMELALSLEKLNFQKLRALHAVADKHSDAALCDFIEGDLLQEQVDSVKQHAVFVSQLRRVGKGVGEYLFDEHLAEEAAA